MVLRGKGHIVNINDGKNRCSMIKRHIRIIMVPGEDGLTIESLDVELAIVVVFI